MKEDLFFFNVSKPKFFQTNYVIMIQSRIPSDELFVRKFKIFPFFFAESMLEEDERS